MFTREEIFYIWLDSFSGLEYKNKKLISDLAADVDYAEVESLLKSEKQTLVSAIGQAALDTLLSSCNRDYIERVLSSLLERSITPITVLSKDYPTWFNDYQFPPFVLYSKGNKELIHNEIFGVVGSRKSSALSLSITESYTESLVNAGFTLVTGIAEGADCTVIKKCLSLGGNIISVIAGGFDNVYPKNHFGLTEEIVNSGGLLLSEQPPDIVPMPFMFPVRNRIIAGLSKGVLVVSGKKKSGTMHTAEYAVEYGKDLFAVPYSVGVIGGEGCNELIKRGAILTDTPNDILEFYGKVTNTEKIRLTEDELLVYRAFDNENRHIEQLSLRTGKLVYELMPIISALEIKGIVAKVGANVYCVSKGGVEE